jgi:hypothetical protein
VIVIVNVCVYVVRMWCVCVFGQSKSLAAIGV